MDESLGELLPEPIRPGRRLGSKYVVGARLGRGAMGVVHEATSHDGRDLAVKFLRAELATDHKTVARFLQERQIFRKIHHPNVVEVHDLVAEGDDLAIVMERVSGGDLKQRIEARSLDPHQSMTIAHQIAAGLAAIHGSAVVHRDLKPANILLTADLTPKISDFGISRIVTEAMTRTSATIGTPIYMAPEAADQRGADAPADVYALGIIMFELLIGRAPFAEGGTFAVLRAHAMDRPPRIEGVPTGLADLIDRMLAKQPEARPTIDAVQARLAELVPQIDHGAIPVAIVAPLAEGAEARGAFDSQEATAGAAGEATAYWPDPATSGDPAAQSGDPAARSGDPAARSGDPAARSGDPAAQSGDPVGRSGDIVIQSSDPAIRSGERVAPVLPAAAAGAAGALAAAADPSATIVNPSLAGDASPGFANAAPPAMGSSPANGFSGLAGAQASTSGGVPFSPGPVPAVEHRSGLAALLPNRVSRRAVEVMVGVGSLAAVLILAFVLLKPDGGSQQAGIDSGGTDTTEPAGAVTNPVGGTDAGDGPTKFGGSGEIDGEGSSSTGTTGAGGASTQTTGSTNTTDGSNPSSSVSTSSTSTSTSTSTSSPTTEATTSTTRPTTSTTRPTTSTTVATTATTATTAPPATPIQIIGGPTVNVRNPTSFQFNYTINNVCGSGSFTVTEVATGTVAGSFTGDGSCYGPTHGGYPGLAGNPDFAGFDIKPDTQYRVAVTVRGVASDGSIPAGSGSDSATFLVTTPA